MVSYQPVSWAHGAARAASRGGPARRRRKAGLVTVELVVAMGILVSVMLPLGYSIIAEQRLARAYYFRAIALELVDSEMEVLMAGEWRVFPPGQQTYHVQAQAATNLPPGQFVLSNGPKELRLEWKPTKLGQGGAVWRVVPLVANDHPGSEERK